MPNILKEIRTCQYDNTIANAQGVIEEVDDGSSGTRNKVSVLPVYEDGRKVHTAVSSTDNVAIGQSDATNTRLTCMNESIGTVSVSPNSTANNASVIYGALETVNTGTQRCGVLTKGTVLFRNTGLFGLSADIGPHPVDLGRIGGAIVGPTRATAGFGDNAGTVQYGRTTFTSTVGTGVILSRVGNYVLVQLEGNALNRTP